MGWVDGAPDASVPGWAATVWCSFPGPSKAHAIAVQCRSLLNGAATDSYVHFTVSNTGRRCGRHGVRPPMDRPLFPHPSRSGEGASACMQL